MTEFFLHYLWQFQYFDKRELKTTSGELVQVIHPGIRNTHAGPDFSDAKIKIGTLSWRGSVEIHLAASGWMDHRHDEDVAYEKVVLHIVWEDDKPVIRADGSIMPTLELKNRVDVALWDTYKKLLINPDSIPCAALWSRVDDVVKYSMLDKVMIQRLETKAGVVLSMLEENLGDWEETAYRLLCRNFGFKVNADSFLRLAEVVPFKIIRKHTDNATQVEAILFGQAGFLDGNPVDDYMGLLAREYNLFGKKYSLLDKKLHSTQWRFLRLRPANFPTIRLAQLAAFLINNGSIFSAFIDTDAYEDLYAKLRIRQSDYWQKHYRFGKETDYVSTLGKSSIHNLMINTAAPLLVAYGLQQDDQRYMERVIRWLQCLPAEKNNITRQWQTLGCKIKSAFDSQAFIELNNAYCLKRRCLDCTIGASLIKPVS
ncbi:MAG: DUF2851 family protein [Cyclobacteriaceae bacterium]|nr:DUF2851 family protein [Cyclobacteriaceae bacterium]